MVESKCVQLASVCRRRGQKHIHSHTKISSNPFIYGLIYELTSIHVLTLQTASSSCPANNKSTLSSFAFFNLVFFSPADSKEPFRSIFDIIDTAEKTNDESDIFSAFNCVKTSFSSLLTYG